MKKGEAGQSVVEFAVILPLLLVVVLGVVEVSYALLDQHVVTKLTREGSTLISRDSTLQDAAAAMKSMSGHPVDFDSSARLILSVIRRGATTTSPNYDKNILYQRYSYGTLSASSKLLTKGPGSFGPGPDFEAANSDNDTNLQLTNLPANLTAGPGEMVYVTEIYATHTLITPFDRFGVSVPTMLYSIAYF
jgi:hypothetical protein